MWEKSLPKYTMIDPQNRGRGSLQDPVHAGHPVPELAEPAAALRGQANARVN